MLIIRMGKTAGCVHVTVVCKILGTQADCSLRLFLLQGDEDTEGKPKDDSNHSNPNEYKSGDNQSGASGGKKPSIISTIRYTCGVALRHVNSNWFAKPALLNRHSLFGGSKNGPKPPDAGPTSR